LNRQQIDVDQLYVDVYVLEKLASESYATIPDLLKGSDLRDGFDRLGLGKREKRSPGFDVATQYSRLMILGKPGAGKTTFLRHLAIACCKDEFLADHIPILIELRDINASEFNLLNHIHQEFDLANEEQTKQILKQGKVLIFLDGLDEVPNLSRREVQDHIYKFSQSTQYYKNRFILTCRTQTTEYQSDKFECVEIAEFKPEQVESFAQNWFVALAETPEQAAELKAKFIAKLTENKPTAELAVTPILLSLTCWVFNDLKDLPAKRSDLYERGVNLLLQEWDEKRGVRRTAGSERYRNLSLTDKKKILSYLAIHKFEQEQFVLFEQDEIQKYIAEYLDISNEESQEVLKAIEAQHGLLIERASGIWSFSHLTFQEYFAAKWFCDRADWEGLVHYLKELHWEEVFLLTVNMAKPADELLQVMKQKVDTLLALDEHEQLQELINWASQKSSTVAAPYKIAAVRAYYLSFVRNPDCTLRSGPNGENDLDFGFYTLESIERKLDPTLDFGPDPTNFASKIFCVHPELSLDLALDCALETKFISVYSYCGYFLNHAINMTSNHYLRQALEQFKEQLPEWRHYSEEEFTDWMEGKGEALFDYLRAVITENRNISYNWQFSNQQWKALWQYYSTNKLLIVCLNSGCVVSDGVREEIEETLLLPIAKVQKR
jgi:predicted NACHT family NTPase